MLLQFRPYKGISWLGLVYVSSHYLAGSPSFQEMDQHGQEKITKDWSELKQLLGLPTIPESKLNVENELFAVYRLCVSTAPLTQSKADPRSQNLLSAKGSLH